MTATVNSEAHVIDLDAPDEPLTRYSAWRPRWTVQVGNGDELGIATDDGCFVVLYPHRNEWRPGTHIPKEVAAQIARLLNDGQLD